ncbi:MAG: SixA phosphatase family protein, partial [Hyphomicrobiales bacterium]
CSTATRARQTLDLALPEFKRKPEVNFTDDLYGAGPADMVKLVRALDETRSHAMLVGHNPGMQALALDLVWGGDDANIRSLAQKFPTAALAVLEFDGSWRELAPGKGFLRIFMVPKALPKT